MLVRVEFDAHTPAFTMAVERLCLEFLSALLPKAEVGPLVSVTLTIGYWGCSLMAPLSSVPVATTTVSVFIVANSLFRDLILLLLQAHTSSQIRSPHLFPWGLCLHTTSHYNCSSRSLLIHVYSSLTALPCPRFLTVRHFKGHLCISYCRIMKTALTWN